ncbi:T9SS type A sorting domain-containing protein [Ferruginibacter albus]|uniref:T9SS type A sorting domain-containing protein n=1 Tax=Ferruginibacter albus TaxID=2875540 RepID=UPI001CC44AB6|nr:T9SS type A sorting domain-containing protein [Ferruginibacter albus]UAY50829.1 T9SS type A sorting domain-containing protein [Ferruginibacter albus]
MKQNLLATLLLTNKKSFTKILPVLLLVTTVTKAQLSSYPTTIDFTAAKPAYITTPTGTNYSTSVPDCNSNITGGISYSSSSKSWTLTATRCGSLIYTIKQPSTARAVTVSNNQNGVTKTTTNTKNTCETDTLVVNYDGSAGNIIITFAGGSGGSGQSIIALTVNDVTVLPVTFTSFNAHPVNNTINFNWSVGVQTNITRYDIESSADGKSFSKIGTVAAANAQSYSWSAAFNADNFYRIKAIDNAGNVSYTNVLSLNANNTQASITATNPVVNHSLTLQLNALKKDNYAVTLYTVSGVKVFSTAIDHAGGSSIKTLQLPTLLQGMYFVKLSGKSMQLNKTIFIQ